MAWAAAIPAIIGAASDIAGGIQGQNASAKQARLNRQWQERMSNTAHQRETKDLEKAGLNRILSISKGGPGASTPAGATARQETIKPGAHVATALAAKRLGQELANMKASEKETDAKTASAKQARMESIFRMKLIREQTRALAGAASAGEQVGKGIDSITGIISDEGIEWDGMADQIARDATSAKSWIADKAHHFTKQSFRTWADRPQETRTQFNAWAKTAAGKRALARYNQETQRK